MKKLNLILCILLALVMAGCGSNASVDYEELLRTVPSNAGFVATVNLQSIIEKTGSKVSGGKIEASPELLQILKSKGSADNAKLDMILDGKSGVDPTVAVFFTDGSAMYMTGFLANSGDFEKAVEQESHQAWSQQGDIKVCGTVAMKDNRYWTIIEGRSSIDAQEVAGYLALSEKQSFAGTDYAGHVSKGDRDIQGWCDIDGLVNISRASFETRSMVKMLTGTIFSDATFLTFDMNFEKGKAVFEANVLDGKGKPAKYNIPAKKLDTSVVEKIGGNTGMLLAMSVPKKLVEQIAEQTKGQMSVLSIMMGSLSCVDGTVAIALDNAGNGKGVIETTGQGTGALMALLNEAGMQSSIDGEFVYFSKGAAPRGTVPVVQLAKDLSGATMGAVVSSGFNPNMGEGLDAVVLKFIPSGGSVKLNVDVITKDKKQNSILTLLQNRK